MTMEPVHKDEPNMCQEDGSVEQQETTGGCRETASGCGAGSSSAGASGTWSRREFITATSLTVAGLALGTVPMLSVFAAEKEGAGTAARELEHAPEFDYTPTTVYYAKPAPKDTKFAMVIDVKACIGCRKCVWACVKENNIGRDSGFTYINVVEMEAGKIELETSNPYYTEGGDPEKWYLPIQCMHCDKPPCVQACPVTATRKEADGLVIQDYRKCIGCRLCMVNCPYHARHFNWKEPYIPPAEINHNPAVPIRPTGVVEKCTFCIHRVREGLETRCTEVCPVRARKFGNVLDPKSEVAQLLANRRLLFRLKEELGTEPSIYYVG